MTQQEFRKALDSFTPDTLMKNRIAAGLEGTPIQRNVKRRIAAGVLAAALAVTCTMGAAMAASPDFRAMVLSFFHLEETEQVPEPGGVTNGPPSVAQGEIGPVKAQYIQLPGINYGKGYGVLYQAERREEDAAVQSVRFWAVEGGGLVELETRNTSFSLTWKGMDIQDTVYWCVWNGQLSSYCAGKNGYASETDWYVRTIPDRADAALLYLTLDGESGYQTYPFLLHLDTGETEDLLAGTGADALETAGEYDWSKDLSKAVISTDSGRDLYLCDRTAGTLTQLELPADTMGSNAIFAGENTLLLFLPAWTEDEGYTAMSCWACDLTTGKAVQTLDREPLYQSWEENPSGSLFFGTRYCVRVTQGGRASVVDLLTSSETQVENFTLEPAGGFLSNPAGTKLLYYVREGEGLNVSQLGVLDLEAGRFIAFDREGYDTVHTSSISWFDDNRVEIWSRPEDNTVSYLYLYEFS